MGLWVQGYRAMWVLVRRGVSCDSGIGEVAGVSGIEVTGGLGGVSGTKCLFFSILFSTQNSSLSSSDVLSK